MEVRVYLDLCGETPIPTDEGGGSGGSQRGWGLERTEKYLAHAGNRTATAMSFRLYGSQ